MTMLSLKNITKTYKGSGKEALSCLNLSIQGGTIVGVSGHNGAGKTTLMGILNGSLATTSGNISYNGLRYTPRLARSVTATMGQSHAPLRGVTPKQAVINSARIRGIANKESLNILGQLTEQFKLESFLNIPSENLSGGMRRLVSFCMCEVQQAEISLLDEPTNDVDPVRRQSMWDYLRSQASLGRTYIVSSHNLTEVSQYTDRQVILQDGKVIFDGEHLAAASEKDNIYITITPANLITEILAASSFDRLSRTQDQIVAPRLVAPDLLDYLLQRSISDADFSFEVSPHPSFEALYASLTGKEK